MKKLKGVTQNFVIATAASSCRVPPHWCEKVIKKIATAATQQQICVRNQPGY